MTLSEIVYNILSSHARGIKFREWNAGQGLDSNMEYTQFDDILI